AAGPKAMIDERLFPLAGATAGAIPDNLPDGKVRLFRLSDGRHEIAYAVREVIDITALDSAILPAAAPGEVEGVTLIGGAPAEVIDAHWLFAQLGDTPAARQPVCRLASDDPWLHNFLRPLAEAAGYRVASDGEDTPTDIAISLADDPAALGPAAPAPVASEIIHLRAARDEQSAAPGSVYRYDRDGLIAALAAARRRIAS
ncbi:MAG: chemotaxis protein CheA, partial [Novosphingobium sp.]